MRSSLDELARKKSLSSTFVIKGGLAAPSFASTLSEVAPLVKTGKAGALESIKEQARRQGHAAGFQEGLVEGNASGYEAGFALGMAEAREALELEKQELFASFARDLQQVKDELQVRIDGWFSASETELEKIAVDVAQRLLDAQLSLDRSFIRDTVVRALSHVRDASQIRIRVNPADSAILQSAKDEILASCAGLSGIEFIVDSSIRAGCIVETERGQIDSTMETRLELLEGGMEDAA